MYGRVNKVSTQLKIQLLSGVCLRAIELGEEAFTETVETVLLTFPSLTTSEATYAPATSAVNVGIADVALLNIAVLPAGLLVNDQLYVNTSPFASLLLLPFKVTRFPAVIFCATPAFATGAAFATDALTVTVETVLLTFPSLTTSEATYASYGY